VNSQLQVFGVENLRVIDASVIPVIPDCRIQNSVYMIAEKVYLQIPFNSVDIMLTPIELRVPTSSRPNIPSCMLEPALPSNRLQLVCLLSNSLPFFIEILRRPGVLERSS